MGFSNLRSAVCGLAIQINTHPMNKLAIHAIPSDGYVFSTKLNMMLSRFKVNEQLFFLTFIFQLKGERSG